MVANIYNEKKVEFLIQHGLAPIYIKFNDIENKSCYVYELTNEVSKTLKKYKKDEVK